MPSSVSIKDDIVEVMWSGTFNSGDATESLHSIGEVLNRNNSPYILILEKVDIFHFDVNEARQIAYLLESYKHRGAVRTGFVASKKVHYGIGRMIGAFCDSSQVHFEVFWDEVSALKWLKDGA
jgi:hypothetical protein